MKVREDWLVIVNLFNRESKSKKKVGVGGIEKVIFLNKESKSKRRAGGGGED